MTKELIVAAVLGTALTAGWFVPVGIEASYTGDRVYQSEMISKNDVDIHSFSLLGRKKEIEVFDMRPASLNGEDLEFDISASNMITTLDVDVIPVDKCIWEYNGTVYEGTDSIGTSFPDMSHTRTGEEKHLRILPLNMPHWSLEGDPVRFP